MTNSLEPSSNSNFNVCIYKFQNWSREEMRQKLVDKERILRKCERQLDVQAYVREECILYCLMSEFDIVCTTHFSTLLSNLFHKQHQYHEYIFTCLNDFSFSKFQNRSDGRGLQIYEPNFRVLLSSVSPIAGASTIDANRAMESCGPISNTDR